MSGHLSPLGRWKAYAHEGRFVGLTWGIETRMADGAEDGVLTHRYPLEVAAMKSADEDEACTGPTDLYTLFSFSFHLIKVDIQFCHLHNPLAPHHLQYPPRKRSDGSSGKISRSRRRCCRAKTHNAWCRLETTNAVRDLCYLQRSRSGALRRRQSLSCLLCPLSSRLLSSLKFRRRSRFPHSELSSPRFKFTTSQRQPHHSPNLSRPSNAATRSARSNNPVSRPHRQRSARMLSSSATPSGTCASRARSTRPS